MKVIKYNLPTGAVGPDGSPVLMAASMDWSEANEAVAKAEAYDGQYVIEDGVDEVGPAPTQLDRIEAQITYTAMMTGTLLEV